MSPFITLSLSFDITAMRAGDWMVILKAPLMALTFPGSLRIIRLPLWQVPEEDQQTLQKPSGPSCHGLSPIPLASPLLSSLAQIGLLRQGGFLAAQLSNPDQLREVPHLLSSQSLQSPPSVGRGKPPGPPHVAPSPYKTFQLLDSPRHSHVISCLHFCLLPCALGKVF